MNVMTDIMRVCAFQIGSNENFVQTTLKKVYIYFNEGKVFDAAIAQKGLDSFSFLGGEFEEVECHAGKVHAMRLRSLTLREKIEEQGGEWKKMVLADGSTIMAIIPPEKAHADWEELEGHLQRLKWKKREITDEEGEKREVIVTCENAENVAPGEKIFLHINSASVCFAMLKGRAGFYLGMGQDICFFDPPGTWKSEGVPSEGAYYDAATHVLKSILDKGYDPSNVVVSSACGGSATAAFAATQVKGLTLILENGYSNFVRDFGEQGWIQKWFVGNNVSALKSKEDWEDKPKETNMNLEETWKDIAKGDIKQIILIGVENDQVIPFKVFERNTELALKVCDNVNSFSFVSESKDPHFDRYYNHPEVAGQVLKAIFEYREKD